MILPFRKPAAVLAAPSDSDLDARVALANPLPDARLSLVAVLELTALRDQITSGTAVGSSPSRPQRWRRASHPLLLVGVILLAAIGGLYAVWGAHTGWFGAPGYTESDTSEWLRGDAPDIVTVVDGFTAKYTLPPGGSWNGLRKTYPKPPGYGYIQVTGIESAVSLDAYCQWQHYWIVGYDTQDAAKMATAQKVLDQFPDLAMSRKTGDSSAIAQWQQIAEFARTNQAVPLENLYSLNCKGPGTQP